MKLMIVATNLNRQELWKRWLILKELDKTFSVSEDEAELLCELLGKTGVGGMNVEINADAAKTYNQELYEIVEESGLKK